MKLAQYTKSDKLIMLGMLSPLVFLLNWLLFGDRYITSITAFLAASVVTFVIMAGSWQMHTWVAVTLRNRLPHESQMVKRIAIAICVFLLLTGLTLTLIFWGYDYFKFLGYQLNENVYKWALVCGSVANIFITFLHESVSSFEKWRVTLKETEDLKREYLQSQLLGLKSQINPHFLFNSLNSLSSLIAEDQQLAEKFLDEMSKVYRYLLRNNDDQLVFLKTELAFIDSYFYLLKARYGDGVDLTVNAGAEKWATQIPPLTLQILLENILNLNAIAKDRPLRIEILVNENGWLQISHNVQKKIRDNSAKEESGLLNISNKFRLLCQQSIIIEETPTHRVIQLPLIPHPETVVA
jgi:hypothetical protein